MTLLDTQLAAAVAAGDELEQLRVIAAMEAEDVAQAAKLTKPNILGASALWYCQRGIHVFPLRPGEKRPATTHGLLDATLDVEQVTAWWTRWPAANIGFPTGFLFNVIDVDGPAGYQSLADLRDAGAIPPILARVVTARGGTHLYVAVEPGRGNKAGLLPGIDYRGAGGYVVAPPSISSEHGTRWGWTQQLNISMLVQSAP